LAVSLGEALVVTGKAVSDRQYHVLIRGRRERVRSRERT
jgi:hypothetical protein